MAENEWFHIARWKKKDEQLRDVSGSSEDDLVFSDDDRFTLSDDVPIVSVNDEEDDFDEEEN
mgnify:CR=1 FL=1|tara:strand:+ start:284 stop:469 length:186 start_codon:yes stop_codon:yes gene_type:complete